MVKHIVINNYRRGTHRCPNYDYASNGSYFITINTLHQKPYFGKIVTSDNRPMLQTTEIGDIVNEYWLQIPNHYPLVQLDSYTIMPNHLHGLLTFHNPNKTDRIPNTFGPQSKNLGAVVRAFKSSVKRYANIHNIEFHWQRNYYDKIIRTDEELYNVRNYIKNNLSKG